MSRNGTWLTAAATRGSSAAAASALPPPIEEPKVATRSGSTPGSARAKAIAARQSSSWRAGSKRSGSPPLSPKPRWSKTSAAEPRRGEALGEGPEAVAAGSREAVGHDHDGRAPAAGGRIEPGGAAVPLGPELEVLSLHALITHGQSDP